MDATALVQLAGARATGWPDPVTSLADVELAHVWSPSPSPPRDRLATVWQLPDRDTGLPHARVMAVKAVLKDIVARLP